MWQENSFFSISEKKQRVPFHENPNQEVGSFLVQLYHQIHECTPATLWHRSWNQPLLFSQLDLSYTYGTEAKAVPLGFGALVWCREFPLPESHFNRVLLSGDSRLGMTMPCLHKQGKMQRASSYKKRQNGIGKTLEIKRLQTTWFLHTCTSV